MRGIFIKLIGEKKREEKYKEFFESDKINLIFNYRGSTEKRSMSDEDIDFF